jgi:hypothetical protein
VGRRQNQREVEEVLGNEKNDREDLLSVEEGERDWIFLSSKST